MMTSNAWKWSIRCLVTILIILIVYFLAIIFTYLKPLFLLIGRMIFPFFLSAIIAYILHPVVRYFERKNIPRTLSILFLYTFFLCLLLFVIFKGTPFIIKEGEQLLEQLPEMANTYSSFASEIHEKTEVLPMTFQEKIVGWLESGEQFIAEYISKLGTVLRQFVDWLFLLIVIPFIVFYLLKDVSLIHKVVWYITPNHFRKEGKKLAKAIDESLGNYIRGQLFVCFIVGTLAYIGFLIIDMPYALLLALFIGLTNVIPYFGPIIAIFPVVFIALTESFRLLFYALIVNIIVQIIEGNIVSPLIVGRSIRMHPVLIIFALVVGGELGGVMGLILSVPILTVLKVILLHVRREIRERKGVYY